MSAPRRTWCERFPATELNARLEEIKEAKRSGWDLEVLIAPGGREIVVVGHFVAFGAVPAGRWRARQTA